MTLSTAISQFIDPLKGAFKITTPFGVKAALGGQMHDGIDFAAPEGTPVYAPADGQARAFTNEGGGNMIELTHPGGLVTGFAHLQRSVVKTGEAVRQGQLIGYTGKTGSLVTGAHLHFYVKQAGKNINPLDIFDFDGQVPSSVYQDVIGDFTKWLKNSTSEDIDIRTWGEYAHGVNTDFVGAPVNATMLAQAVSALGWDNKTIEVGDLEKMAAELSATEPPKAPWDVAAEAAANIAEVFGAVATFLFDPVNWARLLALIAGGVLTYAGFTSMWRAAES